MYCSCRIKRWHVSLTPINRTFPKCENCTYYKEIIDPSLKTPATIEEAMAKICPYKEWIPRYRKIIEDVYNKQNHNRITEFFLNDTNYYISVTLDDGQGGNLWTYFSTWKE